MTDINDIQTLQQQPEGQLFDRKSFRIDAKALGVILVAFAHRDYSILGTDIMVKIFDHHYVVESPGILPGLVRIDNIRQMHFSRNPKIAEFMREYKLVKEFGEGVDRMFREMAEAGNPAPEYKQVEFMVKVRLNSALREENESPITYDDEGNKKVNGTEEVIEKVNERQNGMIDSQKGTQKNTQKREKWPEKWPENAQKILDVISSDKSTTIAKLEVKLNIGHTTLKKILREMQNENIIRRVGPDKGGHWEVINNLNTDC